MDWPGRLETVREVDIETRRSADAPTHLTTIWVVVSNGTVYVRSWRGDRARWFREVSAYPDAVLHVADDAVPVRAIPATDADAVVRASVGFRRKYGRTRIVDEMLADEILHTTLRLEPR